MPKAKRSQETRDFLVRGLPVEVADKLKVAASLHKVPMKAYLRSLLEVHLDELEKRGRCRQAETKRSNAGRFASIPERPLSTYSSWIHHPLAWAKALRSLS